MRALFWRAVEIAPTVVIAASEWIKNLGVSGLAQKLEPLLSTEQVCTD